MHDVPPFVNVGVTIMVAVTGVLPVFRPMKVNISPLPLAASPILVVLFDQA